MTQAPHQPSPPITRPNAVLHGLGHLPNQSHSIRSTHQIPLNHPDSHPDPLTQLDRILAAAPNHHWLLTLSYDLASQLENKLENKLEPTLSTFPAIPFPAIIAQQLESSPAAPSPNQPWSVDPSKLNLISKSQYTNKVRTALDYIAAGDIYQVNLAHPITLPFQGCAASLATHLFKNTNPAMGSFTCFDSDPESNSESQSVPTRHAVISLSPETFLTYDANTNTLTTEPMKGTRSASDDPDELMYNPKDRAELNMIIDLMRNDLARISIPSSVRVTNPRQITTHHQSVHQATATIKSTPRPNTKLTDILQATFPPGSITGAPKIRAMQIIQVLESTHPPRAPYCGSTIALAPGPSTNTFSFKASVNIRTLHIQGSPSPDSPHAFKDAVLTYHTGAGIVADSDPDSEWQETLTKAAILESTLGITLPH